MISEIKVLEVLEAFKRVLKDSLALDYCRVEGKDRALVLAHPLYKVEAKHIKAEYYIREIDAIEEMITALKTQNENDSSRIGEEEGDNTKIMRLQMQAQAMRRELLSLTNEAGEAEETNAINVFFIDLTKEEFEQLQNVEVHKGNLNSELKNAEDEESLETLTRAKSEMNGIRKKRDPEIKDISIEYKDEDGEMVVEDA